MNLRKAHEPGRLASGALAVLVHVMFFGLLVFGLSWQKKIASPIVVDLWQDLPEPVKRVALPPEPPKPAPKPAPKPVPQPPKPVPEVRKEPVVPPPPPKVETPRPSAADIELKEKLRKQKEEDEARREEEKKAEAQRKEEQKKAELEKRKLEEEQRKAAEEQKREEAEQKREEAEQKRAEQEQLRKEEEARRAEEQKRLDEQRRVEEAKREEDRKQHEIAMERERQQMEAARKVREAEEAKRRAEAVARAAQDKLVADYVARIKAQVQRRVVLPPNMDGNPQAEFYVVLIPGGEVLSATLRKSSGNSAYDAAVERAIMVAQPLPVPTEPDLFQDRFREIVLKFRPKE